MFPLILTVLHRDSNRGYYNPCQGLLVQGATSQPISQEPTVNARNPSGPPAAFPLTRSRLLQPHARSCGKPELTAAAPSDSIFGIKVVTCNRLAGATRNSPWNLEGDRVCFPAAAKSCQHARTFRGTGSGFREGSGLEVGLGLRSLSMSAIALGIAQASPLGARHYGTKLGHSRPEGGPLKD